MVSGEKMTKRSGSVGLPIKSKDTIDAPWIHASAPMAQKGLSTSTSKSSIMNSIMNLT